MNALLLVGRICYSAIFLVSGPKHFSKELIDYGAANGVPLAGFLVPAAGLLATLGAACLALGWRARLGAWMLILFLLPVTLTMHAFWGLEPAEAMQQQIHFLKNLSMLGGAVAFAYFGGGPYSLDSRREARKVPVGERERQPLLR